MTVHSAHEAEHKFGRLIDLIDLAHAEPMVIAKHDWPEVVVLPEKENEWAIGNQVTTSRLQGED